MPVNDAGMRTDPPPSVPTDHVPMPRPTAVADPPLEPPEVSPAPQGLPVMPCRFESVTPFQANSGVLVLPRKTVPASRSRAVAGASSRHLACASIRLLPRTVGQPLVRNMSLIETGTPSAGPIGAPAPYRAAEASAIDMATSSSTRTNALTACSCAAIASSAARVASTGLNSPLE